MVPAVDLHVLPSFTVLCQSMNFVRKGGFLGLISFVAYSFNRILCPPGLGLPCVSGIRNKVLVANMIGTRKAKYDSKERSLEGIKLTTEVGC